MKRPPSEYMKSEQVYHSFEPDEQTLNFVMDYVGEDRLVFASDYNHEISLGVLLRFQHRKGFGALMRRRGH